MSTRVESIRLAAADLRELTGRLEADRRAAEPLAGRVADARRAGEPVPELTSRRMTDAEFLAATDAIRLDAAARDLRDRVADLRFVHPDEAADLNDVDVAVDRALAVAGHVRIVTPRANKPSRPSTRRRRGVYLGPD